MLAEALWLCECVMRVGWDWSVAVFGRVEWNCPGERPTVSRSRVQGQNAERMDDQVFVIRNLEENE